MLGSTLAAGLLFTILVWVDSHVWIYLRKRYICFYVEQEREIHCWAI